MGGWRVLTLPGRQSDPSRPTLLIKHHFESTHYVVYLTDLVHVWEESLDRRNIIKRALNDGTSIDPSEGPDQFKLLLNHIRDSLDGVAGRLRLQEGEKPDHLSLQAEVELPIPLEPLKWTMLLERKSNNVLFERLNVALFKHCFRREAEVESLLQRIVERDNAVLRLIDKLDSSNIDLASIFPGAGFARGPKNATRENLLRAVPALKPFDEHEWRLLMDSVKWTSREDLLSKTFTPDDGLKGTEEWTLPGDWWSALATSGIELASASKDNLKSSFSSMPSFSPKISGLTEDDFQIQDVSNLSRGQLNPARVQVKDSQLASAQVLPNGADSTTEDEDDLDTTPVSPPPPSRSPNKKDSPIKPPPVRRLGMLGGKAKQQPVKSPSPTPQSIEIDTDSPRGVLVPDSFPEPAAARPRKKIGKIGGLVANPSKPSVELPLRSSEDRDLESGSEANRKPSSDDRKSRAIDRAVKKTPPRETSTERADRKREELKRELEGKRNAPAKKKRKF